PFAPRVPVLARYFAYAFEAYCVSWTAAFCILSLRFIPAFADLPQRYFVDMPDSVSLRPLGEMFLDYALLGGAVMPFFLFQHYVFRTYQTVPEINHLYVVVALVLIFFCLAVSQIVIRQSLTKLKNRRLVEFSYHVESAFDDFVKSPGKVTFDRLSEQ